ncbi:MAG: helix-turn-helix domain-containing protein [Candidatus Methanomethylicaceae archaeon]
MSMLQGDKYYTVREAAERLKVSPGRIHQFICEGRIESVKFGYVRAIPEREVIRLERERKNARRPQVSS